MSITHRSRRRAVISAATIALTFGAGAYSAEASGGPLSNIAHSCERAGGTFSGDGSVRPSCEDARLRSPWTWRAAQQCHRAHGTFAIRIGDDKDSVDWECDISAL